MRKIRSGWILLLVVALVAPHAHAKDWPMRPIKIIVGGAPASGPDLVARMVAERLGPSLGQAVIIENKGLSCRPCTTIGSDSCPKGHFECMKGIASEIVIAQL